MLSELRITQRLSLLLLLPLAAVVLVGVPFIIERVDDARAAAVVVRTADNARLVGDLVRQLQRERLLALGYLASDRMSRDALVIQMQAATDSRNRARDGDRKSVV